MGGPSAESKANEKAQADFFAKMTDEQTQMFGSVSTLMDQIKNVSLPILLKGPQQYGFTPEEEAILRGQITDQGAKATTDAVNAQKLATLQRTGGTDVLGSGAEASLEEQARVVGGQTTATNLTQEKLSGYQMGNQLYTQALGALSGVAQQQNPIGYATAATGAGSSSTDAIKLADSERSTLLQTLLGGAIGGGLDVLTGGLSNIVGNATKNLGSPKPMGA